MQDAGAVVSRPKLTLLQTTVITVSSVTQGEEEAIYTGREYMRLVNDPLAGKCPPVSSLVASTDDKSRLPQSQQLQCLWQLLYTLPW